MAEHSYPKHFRDVPRFFNRVLSPVVGGHPLYRPSPPDRAPQLGSIGYYYDGQFEIIGAANDPDFMAGIPAPPSMLQESSFTNTEGIPNPWCGTSQASLSLEASAGPISSTIQGKISFRSSCGGAAFLHCPERVVDVTTIRPAHARATLQMWFVEHIHLIHKRFREREGSAAAQMIREEDLELVYGYTKASSWLAGVAMSNMQSVEVSIAAGQLVNFAIGSGNQTTNQSQGDAAQGDSASVNKWPGVLTDGPHGAPLAGGGRDYTIIVQSIRVLRRQKLPNIAMRGVKAVGGLGELFGAPFRRSGFARHSTSSSSTPPSTTSDSSSPPADSPDIDDNLCSDSSATDEDSDEWGINGLRSSIESDDETYHILRDVLRQKPGLDIVSVDCTVLQDCNSSHRRLQDDSLSPPAYTVKTWMTATGLRAGLVQANNDSTQSGHSERHEPVQSLNSSHGGEAADYLNLCASVHASRSVAAPKEDPAVAMWTDTDRRKKRRNRTTHSCINCHTTKRKCDRKRPCQRCTQLGLTGLCVYEVNDPNSPDDLNLDEPTRLRMRIAELEGVIRELQNKPHPRWLTQTNDSTFRTRSQHTSDSSLVTKRKFDDLAGDKDSVNLSLLSYRQVTPSEDRSVNFSGSGESLDMHDPFAGSSDEGSSQNHTFSSDSSHSHRCRDPLTSPSYCGCLSNATAFSSVMSLEQPLRTAVDALSNARHSPQSATTSTDAHCSLLAEITRLQQLIVASIRPNPKLLLNDQPALQHRLPRSVLMPVTSDDPSALGLPQSFTFRRPSSAESFDFGPESTSFGIAGATGALIATEAAFQPLQASRQNQSPLTHLQVNTHPAGSTASSMSM